MKKIEYDYLRQRHMSVLEKLEELEDKADGYLVLPKRFWDELVEVREEERVLRSIMEDARYEEV